MSQWLNILCIMFKIFQTPLFTHYNVGSGTAITQLTTTCPDEFLGVFDYVSNITASGECNGTGSVDVCSDTLISY
jgi:hypothetical protein